MCHRHVFVIGGHGAGKTTLAGELQKQNEHWTVTSADGWLQTATGEPRRVPTAELEWIRRDCGKGTAVHVVDGVRRADVFSEIFNPGDLVVMVQKGEHQAWELPDAISLLELLITNEFVCLTIEYRTGLDKAEEISRWVTVNR